VDFDNELYQFKKCEPILYLQMDGLVFTLTKGFRNLLSPTANYASMDTHEKVVSIQKQLENYQIMVMTHILTIKPLSNIRENEFQRATKTLNNLKEEANDIMNQHVQEMLLAMDDSLQIDYDDYRIINLFLQNESVQFLLHLLASTSGGKHLEENPFLLFGFINPSKDEITAEGGVNEKISLELFNSLREIEITAQQEAKYFIKNEQFYESMRGFFDFACSNAEVTSAERKLCKRLMVNLRQVYDGVYSMRQLIQDISVLAEKDL